MKKGVFILLAILASTRMYAMDPVDYQISDSISVKDSTEVPSYSWINLGLGTSLDYPVAFNIGLNYQLQKYLFSVRFLITDELDLQNQSSSESVWDAGILLGRIFKNDYGLVSFSAGLSFVGGLKRGEYISNDETWGGYYNMKHRATLGIPLESHLVYTLSRNAGIGITAFGNLNMDKPFFGALLSLHLGIIR